MSQFVMSYESNQITEIARRINDYLKIHPNKKVAHIVTTGTNYVNTFVVYEDREEKE